MSKNKQSASDQQALLNSVSADRLMQDVEQIASWVRLSGTAEEREAFEYLERRLREAGLQTQLLEHEALISLPEDASLTVEGADGQALDCIAHSFAASTPDEGIAAPAVYVGDLGTEQTLSGRIVVIDGLAMPNVVAKAEALGAAGAVFLNRDPHVHEMIVSTVWGSPPPERMKELPQIPVVSMAGEDADSLRELIADTQDRVSLRLHTRVDTGWRKIPLLVADLPGQVEDTFVMFAGHVDSWHYGAMDNGTANATMLEVARLLADVDLYRGLRLTFWSGHSHGRYAGSTWYADTHWTELAERCVAHVNVDSVGGRNATRLDNGYCMPETHAVGARAVAAVTDQTFRGSWVGRAGDQSFLGIGVPSLFMSLSEQPANSPDASRDFAITGGDTGGLGWWWHTPEDTPDKIDPDNLVRDAQVYVAAVHELCASPVLPLDYAATAATLSEQLRKLQEQLGDRFDLSDCVTEAEALSEAMKRLNERIAAIDPEDWIATIALNQALLELSRTLIPVLYTRAGRFDHDPATSIPELPPLADAVRLTEVPVDSEEAPALRVAARRGRNELLHAVRTARLSLRRAATSNDED